MSDRDEYIAQLQQQMAWLREQMQAVAPDSVQWAALYRAIGDCYERLERLQPPPPTTRGDEIARLRTHINLLSMPVRGRSPEHERLLQLSLQHAQQRVAELMQPPPDPVDEARLLEENARAERRAENYANYLRRGTPGYRFGNVPPEITQGWEEGRAQALATIARNDALITAQQERARARPTTLHNELLDALSAHLLVPQPAQHGLHERAPTRPRDDDDTHGRHGKLPRH